MRFREFLGRGGMALLLVVVLDLEPELAAGDAKVVRLKVSVMAGGDEQDLDALGRALARVPGVKVKADELEFSNIRRDDAVFTKPASIELDLGKSDIGVLAKAVAAAPTATRDRVAPALYLVVGYEAGGANQLQLRGTLANVKGVDAEKSFVGDVNLWIKLDGSGAGKLNDLIGALKGVGIPVKDQP